MTQQTVTQIGNSLGVVIPASIRKSQNIKKGDKLYVEELPNGGIKISDADSQGYSVNSDFKNWLDGFNKEYGKTLQELANR